MECDRPSHYSSGRGDRPSHIIQFLKHKKREIPWQAISKPSTRTIPMKHHIISSSLDPPDAHDRLYQYWERSQGLWFSKLAKVTLRFLDKPELQNLQRIHTLEQPEFGIRMAWEYQTKADVGQMRWIIDAAQPNLIFTSQGITDESPPDIYQYRMIDDQTLVTTKEDVEERTALESDRLRIRELRTGGKLVKRLWENKFNA
jgi:hypothetical protein